MKLGIASKLMSSFSAMAVLVLLAAGVGIWMTGKVADSNKLIVEEKAPFADVAMEAKIASEKGLSACREYIIARGGLEEIEGRVGESIEDFKMWIDMIRYGTDSKEFKESPSGKMYVKDEVSVKTPKGTPEMVEFAESASKRHDEFEQKAKELIAVHKKRVQYFYNDGKVEYDLYSFMVEAEMKHANWFKKLEESVEYSAKFSEELDPEKCDLGRFYNSYRRGLADEQLAVMLDEMQEIHKKVHQEGANVVNAPDNEKEAKLKRANRFVKKLSPKFAEIQKYAFDTTKVLRDSE
ncbi:MAG: CZB domain-containing protein, partial [Pseudomonadota bacterium]